MKSISTFLMVFITSLALNAQYRKLPLDNDHYWQQTIKHVGSMQEDYLFCSYILKVQKDSVINGKTYKWVMSQNPSCNDYKSYEEFGLIREDTLLRLVTIIKGQQEKILYNFSKNVGDTAMMLTAYGTMGLYTLGAKDSILMNDGYLHRRFIYGGPNGIPFSFLEGVGSLTGLLQPWRNTYVYETYFNLLCLSKISTGTPIYISIGTSCPITTDILSYKTSDAVLSIYPSPSTDFIKIENDGYTINSAEIRDVLGQTVLQFPYINSNTVDLCIANLPTGLYFITIQLADNSVTRQLIKN